MTKTPVIDNWLATRGMTETSRTTPTGQDRVFDRVAALAAMSPVAARLVRTIGYNLRNDRKGGVIRLDGSAAENKAAVTCANRLRNVGILVNAKQADGRLSFGINTRDKDLRTAMERFVNGRWIERAGRQLAADTLGDQVQVVANLAGTGAGGTWELDVVLAWPDGTVRVVEAKAGREVSAGLPRFRTVCTRLGLEPGGAIMLTNEVDPDQAEDAASFHGITLVDGPGYVDLLRSLPAVGSGGAIAPVRLAAVPDQVGADRVPVVPARPADAPRSRGLRGLWRRGA